MMRKTHAGAVLVVAGMWLIAGMASAGGVKPVAGGKAQVAQLPILGPLQAGISTPLGKLGVAINKAPLAGSASGSDKTQIAQLPILGPAQAGVSTPLGKVGIAINKAPLLNQMTSTDLAGGFQQFMTQLKQTSPTAPQQSTAAAGQSAGSADELETTTPEEQEVGGDAGLATAGAGALANLTPEQQQQIQNLQGQLDSGAIDQNAFASQVQNVLGTAAPGYMVGGLGGAFDQTANTAAADPLNLTDAQLQQAQDIATQMHTDIAALREAAHALIVELLTPDQQALLSASTTGEAGEAGEGVASQQAAPTQTATGSEQTGTAQSGQNGLSKQLVPMRTPLGSVQAANSGTQSASSGVASSGTTAAGSVAGGSAAVLQNPADRLQLTEAQQTQVEQIRAALRTAVQARHQQARDEFRAILTPAQQAVLDQMEQSYGTETTGASAAAGGQQAE